jgi:hypothetical protein
MDEKTEQLRDIFMDVTESETVTERQAQQRGSLVRDGDGEQQLSAIVARMREEVEFGTDLDDGTLCRVVREFYEGADDAEIAATLSLSEETVFRARMDLHLVREEDAPVDLGALGDATERHDSVAEVARELGTDAERIVRARRVLAARESMRRSSHRFRTAFEELLTDADLAGGWTDTVREDGIRDAAEGSEAEVDF